MSGLAKFYEKKWSKDVDMKWDAPEGFFNKSAINIAKGLKKDSKDLKQAMSRLSFYINRAGKNLSKDDKNRLENAKDELKKLYNKKESVGDKATHIRAIDQNLIEIGVKSDERIIPLGQLNLNSAIKNFGSKVIDHAISKFATTIDPSEDWVPIDLDKHWSDVRKKTTDEARNGTKSQVFKKPVDLGGGIYLHKIGIDANGNKSIWASRGANRSIKFQTNDDMLHFIHNIVIDDIKHYLEKPEFRSKLSSAIKAKMGVSGAVKSDKSESSLLEFAKEQGVIKENEDAKTKINVGFWKDKDGNITLDFDDSKAFKDLCSLSISSGINMESKFKVEINRDDSRIKFLK